jgi:hypothetical protein
MLFNIMKKLILMFCLFLCLGLVSAHDVSYKEKFSESKYYPHERVVLSRTVLADYYTDSQHKNLRAGNDDRHSTYDYRHGYSYRTTRDFFEDKHENVFDDRDNYKGRYSHSDEYYRGYRSDYRRDSYHGKKGYYSEYVPHLRDYEKRECYLTAPTNKLFYVKC